MALRERRLEHRHQLDRRRPYRRGNRRRLPSARQLSTTVSSDRASDRRHDAVLQKRRYSSASAWTAHSRWMALVSSTISVNAPTFNVAQGGTGSLIFQNAATAGDAVINTETGGTTSFTGKSNGGSAHFNASGTGVVDFSGTFGPIRQWSTSRLVRLRVTAKSYLGSNTLTVSAPTGTFAGITWSRAATRVVPMAGSGTRTLGGTYLGITRAQPRSTAARALLLTMNGLTSMQARDSRAWRLPAPSTSRLTAVAASMTTLADSASGQAGTVNLGDETLTITSGASTFSGVFKAQRRHLTITGGDQTLAGVATPTPVRRRSIPAAG